MSEVPLYHSVEYEGPGGDHGVVHPRERQGGLLEGLSLNPHTTARKGGAYRFCCQASVAEEACFVGLEMGNPSDDWAP